MAITLVVGLISGSMAVARKASGPIRRARRVILIAAVVIAVLAAWWVALAAAAGVASALPSLLPLGCAAYVGALTYRGNPRPGRWADVFLAGAVGVGLAAAFRPGVVADDPAAFLLFIAIAGLAARLWRSMRDSGNRMVRGSADVATALLLGATLDLVVVWSGNLAGLSALTVLRVSHLLNAVADGNDPAWWYTAVPLLLLAACYVAVIRWGSRLAELGAWAQRRRLVRSAGKLPGLRTLRPRLAVAAFNSSRRVMQFLHVGLVLVPLVGMTAPALLGQAVLGPLRPRYVIAYEAERDADAQVLAYQRLTREIAAAPPGQRAALRKDVEDITSSVNGSGGAGGSWFTAASPAAGIGEEEAAYLQYAGETATGAGPAPPPLSTDSATTVAAQAEAMEGDAEQAESYADKAGAAAAAAIATMLSIPPGGGAVQILQEYLGGLTEESPVADALAGLAGRLGGDAAEDPDAEQALDPGQAEQAAASGEISQSSDNGSSGSGGGSSTGTDDGGDGGGGDGGGGDGGGGDGGGGDGGDGS